MARTGRSGGSRWHKKVQGGGGGDCEVKPIFLVVLLLW